MTFLQPLPRTEPAETAPFRFNGKALVVGNGHAGPFQNGGPAHIILDRGGVEVSNPPPSVDLASVFFFAGAVASVCADSRECAAFHDPALSEEV